MAALFYLVSMAMLPQWYRDGGISISKFLFWNLTPLALWAGVTWLMGQRVVPGPSFLLPPGARVRVVQHETPQRADTASLDQVKA
jgi:hypothetical protein